MLEITLLWSAEIELFGVIVVEMNLFNQYLAMKISNHARIKIRVRKRNLRYFGVQ